MSTTCREPHLLVPCRRLLLLLQQQLLLLLQRHTLAANLNKLLQQCSHYVLNGFRDGLVVALRSSSGNSSTAQYSDLKSDQVTATCIAARGSFVALL
jgi:hypothetical protein